MNIRAKYIVAHFAERKPGSLPLVTVEAILIVTLLLGLFALAGFSSLELKPNYKNDDIPCATNPRCEGINLFATARFLHISAGRIHFDDKTIATSAQTLIIPPSPVLQIRFLQLQTKFLY